MGETDTISRQAAIEIVDRYNKSHMILQGKPMLGAASIVIELEALPSAQPDVPERNVGKWLEKEVIPAEEAEEIITEWQSCKCSVCGRYDTRPYLYSFMEPIFCSWCGAEMKGENDAETD